MERHGKWVGPGTDVNKVANLCTIILVRVTVTRQTGQTIRALGTSQPLLVSKRRTVLAHIVTDIRLVLAGSPSIPLSDPFFNELLGP